MRRFLNGSRAARPCRRAVLSSRPLRRCGRVRGRGPRGNPRSSRGDAPGPSGEGGERAVQFDGHVGRPVLDLRRHGRMDGPRDQSVALKVAQGQREHAATAAGHRAFQFGETGRPVADVERDADRPFAADPVQRLQDGADLALVRGLLDWPRSRRAARSGRRGRRRTRSPRFPLRPVPRSGRSAATGNGPVSRQRRTPERASGR
jgi:hypothetical protein